MFKYATYEHCRERIITIRKDIIVAWYKEAFNDNIRTLSSISIIIIRTSRTTQTQLNIQRRNATI